MITPVILSGGSGTRLWPLSRKLHPKQLLPLINETSLLQDTINRLQGLTDINKTVVVCNEEYRFIVADQVQSTTVANNMIILEPVGRNTAPAIALAAIMSIKENADAVLLVLPADHVIEKTKEFHAAVALGLQPATDGHFVAFGVIPTSPETDYGYIRPVDNTGFNGVADIESFIEKPDLETAAAYIDEGGYYWNSGMYMFRASVYLEALSELSPEIYACCQQAVDGAARDRDFLRVDVDAFTACPGKSIDYAVMEKVENAVVIPVDIGWSDVGSWSVLHDIGKQDEDENVFIGDTKNVSTKNCYVRAEHKLVATLGVEDLIIVDTDDALLVADKNSVHHIKEIVDSLTVEKREETLLHKRVSRPWGYYEAIARGEQYHAKCITINIGAVLSLQLHNHRAEHWIIVSGTAKVIVGEDEFVLSENESTYIPLGTRHHIENIGSKPLELIEVQTGSYFGEDDIVRFEDAYGRERLI